MTTKTNTTQDVKAAVDNMAAKATAEFKAARESFVEATSQAAEETKTALVLNQEIFQKSFEMWQEYTQAYANFLIGATQQTLEQSLAWREQWAKVLADSLKRAQTLSATEQKLAFDATELFQAQAQTASEQATKLFKTTSKLFNISTN